MMNGPSCCGEDLQERAWPAAGRTYKEGPTCCREDLLVATKVAGPSGQMHWIRGGPHSLSAHNITEAIDGSLHRLQTDYIDLIQLHWPDRSGVCLTTPAAVTGLGPATASGAGLGAAEGAMTLTLRGTLRSQVQGAAVCEHPASCCRPWQVVSRHHRLQQVLLSWLPVEGSDCPQCCSQPARHRSLSAPVPALHTATSLGQLLEHSQHPPAAQALPFLQAAHLLPLLQAVSLLSFLQAAHLLPLLQAAHLLPILQVCAHVWGDRL